MVTHMVLYVGDILSHKDGGGDTGAVYGNPVISICAPEARKGIGSPVAGTASTRPLIGRHSRSLECLFRAIQDRAT